MAQQLAGGSSLDFYVVGTLTQDDQKDYDIGRSHCLEVRGEEPTGLDDQLRSVAPVSTAGSVADPRAL